MTTERERIARLGALFGGASPGVTLGIGDDAAVLTPPAGALLVWTVDAQVEGVHFERAWLGSLEDLGYRAFMAAASDVAAMGAAPWCALAALELPAGTDDDALDAIALGQREAAVRVGAPIVGGNLSRGPVLAITTTLLGTAARPVTRSGARVGDGLWLAGPVGLAAAGLAALARGVKDARLDVAIAAWRRPRALTAEGRGLAGVAHAAVDVSDGLARDLDHLAIASGVCATVDEAALRGHGGDALGGAAAALGRDALDLALHGGEDYALLAASATPLPGFTRIGEIRGGRGLVLCAADGREAPLAARGFDHFGGRET